MRQRVRGERGSTGRGRGETVCAVTASHGWVPPYEPTSTDGTQQASNAVSQPRVQPLPARPRPHITLVGWYAPFPRPLSPPLLSSDPALPLLPSPPPLTVLHARQLVQLQVALHGASRGDSTGGQRPVERGDGREGWRGGWRMWDGGGG